MGAGAVVPVGPSDEERPPLRRLFVALPLPAEVIAELTSLSVRLRGPGDGLRWSAPESWHITLQFLGTVDAEQYRCLSIRLRELAAAAPPVRMEGAGLFERVGIFFAAVVLDEGLRGLQKSVVGLTELCGFAPETRPYHPHVTLARSKGKAGRQGLSGLRARGLREPRAMSFDPAEVCLYESVAGAGGPRYVVRERFPLG